MPALTMAMKTFAQVLGEGGRERCWARRGLVGSSSRSTERAGPRPSAWKGGPPSFSNFF